MFSDLNYGSLEIDPCIHVQFARHNFVWSKYGVSRRRIIPQFDARAMTRPTVGLRSADRHLCAKERQWKRAWRERKDWWVHPPSFRVVSDVDGGLEKPKRSTNHVMAHDADETYPNSGKCIQLPSSCGKWYFQHGSFRY